jgi:type IV pilus assembly protein PilQ
VALVGDSAVVGVAEQYLRQLDLRQRQVALSVKILDVSLQNDAQIDSSFAWRWGNNFIVNNSGRLAGSFGGLALSADLPGSAPAVLPDSDNFYAWVRAQVVSGSTKLLASPTLILQENPSVLREGDDDKVKSQLDNASSAVLSTINLDQPIGRRRANEGVVRVGTNVVTSYSTDSPAQGGNIVCTPNFSTAGLVLGARVEKIDDNGFVTFTLSPSVSAVTDIEQAPFGCSSALNILSVRSLDTGALRVRDGQTLVLTGVISETDRTEVTKWPILGDIPLIGQFFRSSGTSKDKRELVIMVTPRIISDEMGGAYGYGYQPATDPARQLFGVGS